jgi:recombination protein RecA
MTKEKSKIDEALEKLNKEYGQGSIVKWQNAKIPKLETISTGSLGLDMAIGIGGLPRGRIVEIYGPESSGKTTMCLHAIAEAQKKGLKAAIIDMEHSMDLSYAKNIGVNIEELIFSQPDYGEQALNTIRSLAETGEVGIILLDSMAACVPKSERDGEIGDSSIGKQARMFSQAFRIFTPILENNNVLLLMTNQLRMKIGVIMGSPEVTACGEAAKFYASVRLDVRKMILKENDEAIANKIKIKVVKNKVGNPYKVVEFQIKYGIGIDKERELVDVASELNIIQKSGSWYSYNGDKLGQGADAVLELLISHPELTEEIKKKVINETDPTKKKEEE